MCCFFPLIHQNKNSSRFSFDCRSLMIADDIRDLPSLEPLLGLNDKQKVLGWLAPTHTQPTTLKATQANTHRNNKGHHTRIPTRQQKHCSGSSHSRYLSVSNCHTHRQIASCWWGGVRRPVCSHVLRSKVVGGSSQCQQWGVNPLLLLLSFTISSSLILFLSSSLSLLHSPPHPLSYSYSSSSSFLSLLLLISSPLSSSSLVQLLFLLLLLISPPPHLSTLFLISYPIPLLLLISPPLSSSSLVLFLLLLLHLLLLISPPHHLLSTLLLISYPIPLLSPHLPSSQPLSPLKNAVPP